MPMNARLLRPLASGTFSPKQISGLVGWWDAADAATVTLSGSLATQWDDKSGLGNNVTAAAGQEPTYEPLAQAGKGGLNWGSTQGNNKGFRINPLATAITGRDVFVVCDWNAGATSTEYAGIFAHGAQLGLNNSGTGFYNVGFSRFSINGAASSTTALPALSAVNVLRGTLSADSTNSVITIGTWGGFTTRGWPGRIYEVIYYDRELSDAEAARVRGYLNAKWRIGLPPVVSNAEAQDWVSRVYANSGTVDESTARAVSTFCDAIDAASIRDRFYRLNLFAGNGLNAALVPLYRGPTFGGTTYGNATDTNNGPFVSADYSESTGLRGNATTKYLDTGLLATSLPDTAHIGVYKPNTTASPSSDRPIGAYDTTPDPDAIFGIRSSATDFLLEARRIASVLVPNTSGGLILVDRSSDALATAYDDGVSVGTTALSAAGYPMPAETIFVFNQNLDGSPIGGGHYDAPLAGYTVGVSMTSAQHGDFATAMTSFQTALGRNP